MHPPGKISAGAHAYKKTKNLKEDQTKKETNRCKKMLETKHFKKEPDLMCLVSMKLNWQSPRNRILKIQNFVEFWQTKVWSVVSHKTSKAGEMYSLV